MKNMIHRATSTDDEPKFFAWVRTRNGLHFAEPVILHDIGLGRKPEFVGDLVKLKPMNTVPPSMNWW